VTEDQLLFRETPMWILDSWWLYQEAWHCTERFLVW